MPLSRPTGPGEGAAGDDGLQGAGLSPAAPVTLGAFVPADHIYRPLERTLDLGFVRDLVRGTYAEAGRPSIGSSPRWTMAPVESGAAVWPEQAVTGRRRCRSR